MRFMYIHGVGFHEKPATLQEWVPGWSGTIQEAARKIGIGIPMYDPLGEDHFPSPPDDPGLLYYEDVIAAHPEPTGGEYLKVVGQLLASYASTKVGEFFGTRGLIPDELKWKARQVAAWALSDELRADLRQRVIDEIEAKEPEVIIAHSYGGLILYDTLLFERPDLIEKTWLVTMGTQIGNALLRREFGGRQETVACKHWFNLYNPRDPVFVASMAHIRGANYTQVVTRHGQGHSGTGYLGFPDTAERVWRPISLGNAWLREATRSRKLFHRASPVPGRRALLIGIDRYADPRIPALGGCVNDTYLLSAALQEQGFEPHEIRLLHNERATRDGVLERLDWLLEDIGKGEERVLAFSGHGDQVPVYDLNGEPDHLDEVLVTHDYDFEAGSGIRDDALYEWYANLPYEARLLMILDCCHSGGTDRDGGPLVRTVSSPSDIAHRNLRWIEQDQMWEQRGLPPLNPDFLASRRASARKREELSLYYGSSGASRRIGRASILRDLPDKRYDRILRSLDQASPTSGARGASRNLGPYLPLIYMACQEDEKACEYVHGAVSYGAFTYSLVQALREARQDGKQPTYAALAKLATRKLKRIGYPQTPSILGAPAQLRKHILES